MRKRNGRKTKRVKGGLGCTGASCATGAVVPGERPMPPPAPTSASVATPVPTTTAATVPTSASVTTPVSTTTAAPSSLQQYMLSNISTPNAAMELLGLLPKDTQLIPLLKVNINEHVKNKNTLLTSYDKDLDKWIFYKTDWENVPEKEEE
jgi:hypothetical protein